MRPLVKYQTEWCQIFFFEMFTEDESGGEANHSVIFKPTETFYDRNSQRYTRSKSEKNFKNQISENNILQ